MLTKGQEKALYGLLDHYKSGNNFALLQGSAGVGKTYLMESFIGKYKGTVLCSAPTHKAVAVLKDKVKSVCTFKTVHSALTYRMNYSKKGEKVFEPRPNPNFPPLEGIDLWVIDEASMVGENMLMHIEEWAKKTYTKVLFVGDEKQINPVKEENSPVFYQNYVTFELTEIVRQGKGNPIINLSRNLHLINKKRNSWDLNTGYLFTSNFSKIIQELASVNGSDDFKYIAYTNKNVDYVNKKVRELLYDKPNKIEIGESIVFSSPYGDIYHTNQELRIRKLEVKTVETKVEIANFPQVEERKFTCTYYLINGGIGEVRVIHEKSEKDFNKLLSEMKSKAKNRFLPWKDYYYFADMFADFKYNHALTVHKS